MYKGVLRLGGLLGDLALMATAIALGWSWTDGHSTWRRLANSVARASAPRGEHHSPTFVSSGEPIGRDATMTADGRGGVREHFLSSSLEAICSFLEP